MLPASSSSPAGSSGFPLPDVCKLPSPGAPVPVPYPTMATSSAAASSASKVAMLQSHGISKASATSAVAGKVVTDPVDKAMFRGMKSQIPSSAGDEAGTAGGVVSGAKAGKAANFAPASVSFKSPPSAGGSSGALVAPSQTKIMVAR